IAGGWRQIHGGGIAGAPFPDASGSLPLEVSRDDAGFDTEHSPLLSLVTAAPLLAWPQALAGSESSPYWRWLPRIPFLAFGIFLGASLWYVSRRLCGNSGGFLALTLYCFSPAVLQATAVWHVEPEILAAWGSFGAIFTAIAVAHTLYAPREVVLELASHRPARHLSRHRRRIPVLHDRRRPHRPCLSALSRAHPPQRRLHHLDRRLSRRSPDTFCH